MSKIDEYYVREVRDQLGRYPNWPIGRSIELGQVGYFNGREANFDWQTTLSAIGVNVPANPPAAGIDELYATADLVRFGFKADSSVGSKVDFTFAGKKSIAMQSYGMSIMRLDLAKLLSELRRLIRTGSLTWDFDWLIVTELWSSRAFTALISGSRRSEISITATVPPPPPGSPFNIANPSFGLGVSSYNGMSYKAIAEQRAQGDIYPFFHVHRLANHSEKGLILKKYGEKDGWLFG